MSAEGAATIFRRLDRELWLLTASAGTERGGLIATFVSQASLVPELPRVLVGLARTHHTWGLVARSGAFGLHLLDETQMEWVWRFGLHSGRDIDKLDGLTTRAGVSGAPRLVDAPSWLDCRVEATLDTGDRSLYLAEVLEADAGPGSPVLTTRRMLELAPEPYRRELTEQIRRDVVLDARAIEAWRSGRRSS